MLNPSRLSGRAARLLLIGAAAACLCSAPTAIAAPAALDNPPVATTPDPGPLPVAPKAYRPNTLARTATAFWSYPADQPRPARFRVYRGDEVVADVVAQEFNDFADFGGLEPDSRYAITVAAVDAAGRVGPRSQEVIAHTRQESAAGVRFSFTVDGSFSLPTLVKTGSWLSGRLDADLDPETLEFTANLKIDDSTVRLVSSGTAPVVATLAFVQSGTITGKLGGLNSGGRDFAARAKLRIKVKDAKLFGAIPIAAGNGCQTKQLVDIPFWTDNSTFGFHVGGPIHGFFAMSDLNGCGALSGLVSPRTASTRSYAALRLTPIQP